jgi:transposase
MEQLTLGIDVACRAAHQASLADAAGRLAWSGRRFRTTTADLDRLWAAIPSAAAVTVVMEPTRNARVPLAAWFRRHGARVILVPPEQSADLRDYYSKHAKSDHLDSRMLARLPLLHPDGLRPAEGLGPADPLRRATKLRASLVKRRNVIVAGSTPTWSCSARPGTPRSAAIWPATPRCGSWPPATPTRTWPAGWAGPG